MNTTETSWYLLDTEQRTGGPYTATQIVQLLQLGKIPLTTLCWREGMSEWLPLEEEALFSAARLGPAESGDTLRFLCSCNNEIVISRRYAGYTVQCQACGRSLVVPTPAPLSPAGSASPPAESLRRRDSPFLLLLLGLVLGLVATGSVIGLLKKRAAQTTRLEAPSSPVAASDAVLATAPKTPETGLSQDARPQANQTVTNAPAPILQPETEAAVPRDRLFVIRQNGRFGYMDSSGHVAIQPRFLAARDFHEGLACVATEAPFLQMVESSQPAPMAPDEARAFANSRFYGPSRSSPPRPSVPLPKGTYQPPPPAVLRYVRKYGYINSSGQMVIPAEFLLANDFSEGVAAVLPYDSAYNSERLAGLASYIVSELNNARRESLLPLFSMGFVPRPLDDPPPTHGLLAGNGGPHFCLIDASGKKLRDGCYSARAEDRCWQSLYSRSSTLHNTVLPAKTFVWERTLNLVDRDLETVARFKSFVEVEPFSEGLARVNIATRGASREYTLEYSWGYVDTRGAVVIKGQFSQARDFHEGCAAVRLKSSSGTWAYIDRAGTVVIDPSRNPVRTEDQVTDFRYLEARDFSEGVAAVRVERIQHRQVNGVPNHIHLEVVWMLINKEGKLQEQTAGGACGRLCENLAARREFHDSGLWGYMDKEGKMIIPYSFDEAEDFSGGLARVGKTGSWAYVNKAGKFVWVEKPEAFGLGADYQNYYPESPSPADRRGSWGVQVFVSDGESSGTQVDVYEAPDRIPDNTESFVFDPNGRKLIASRKTNSQGICAFQGLKPPFFVYITRRGFKPEFRYVTSTEHAYHIVLNRVRPSQ